MNLQSVGVVVDMDIADTVDVVEKFPAGTLKLLVTTASTIALVLLIIAASCQVAFTQTASRFPLKLDGLWRFELDASDAGLRQEWFKRSLQGKIRLPGILQSQDYGQPISANTPWVLTLYDRFWYLREDYKAYAEPGKVKVPFLSQPPRH